MKRYVRLHLPAGDFFLAEENGALTNAGFMLSESDLGIKETTPLLKEALAQLTAYFDGRLFEFDLPLALKGTEFQTKVWNALKRIPYARTRTYAEIAEETGNKNAARAVGNANNKNPIAVIIPCHRVIGANGALTGYAAGLDIKRFLLNLEQRFKDDVR